MVIDIYYCRFFLLVVKLFGYFKLFNDRLFKCMLFCFRLGN